MPPSPLAASMPDFKPAAVLLKVVAVNSLYGTNVYAVDRAAQHIGMVRDGVKLASAERQLVEEMAAIPPLPGGKARRHRSFASKFAHFFIDHHRFPIHDSFAARMLKAHLDRDAPAPDSGATYMAIEAAFRTLAQSAGLCSDTRRVDRYLWIVGQYRDWTNNPKGDHKLGARAVFEADPPELAVTAGIWYRPRG